MLNSSFKIYNGFPAQYTIDRMNVTIKPMSIRMI